MRLIRFLTASLTVALGLLILFAAAMLPDILSLRTFNPGRTALMREKGGPVTQQWVPLSGISTHLQNAVLIGEDRNFYQHTGIDFFELKQSIRRNWKKKHWARGASTLTMQLAKNLYLSTRKSPLRKILEVLITLEMELLLPKSRILEIYLNVIEWGPGIYGAEAAALHYFKKPAAHLSGAETAELAAIIPNPRLYRLPRYRRHLDRRQRWILARLGLPPAKPPGVSGVGTDLPPAPIPEPLGPIPPEDVEPEPLPPEEELPNATP